MTRDQARRRAVFVDRDGILIELVQRDGLLSSPRRLDEFRLVRDAAVFIEGLRDLGLLVFVVTNQPDIARGKLTPWVLAEMTRRLHAEVALDDVLVCPHDDADRCECRKPKPGMLVQLAAWYGLDLGRSFMVGDTWKDVEAGRRAGCRTIRVGGHGSDAVGADCVVAGLLDAVRVIANTLAAKDRDVTGIHP